MDKYSSMPFSNSGKYNDPSFYKYVDETFPKLHTPVHYQYDMINNKDSILNKLRSTNNSFEIQDFNQEIDPKSNKNNKTRKYYKNK